MCQKNTNKCFPSIYSKYNRSQVPLRGIRDFNKMLVKFCQTVLLLRSVCSTLRFTLQHREQYHPCLRPIALHFYNNKASNKHHATMLWVFSIRTISATMCVVPCRGLFLWSKCWRWSGDKSNSYTKLILFFAKYYIKFCF